MQRVSRWMGRVSMSAGVIAGVAITVMMLATASDVGRRYIEGSSILGVYELVELLVTITFFSTIAYTQSLKGHVRMEALVSRLPQRYASLLEAILYFLIISFMAVLLWVTWEGTLASIAMREFRFGNVHWPIWPAKLVMVTAVTILLFQFLVHAIEDLVRFFRYR